MITYLQPLVFNPVLRLTKEDHNLPNSFLSFGPPGKAEINPYGNRNTVLLVIPHNLEKVPLRLGVIEIHAMSHSDDELVTDTSFVCPSEQR